MQRQMRVANLNCEEWFTSFQSAINLRDVQNIHELLSSLPKFTSHDEMKTFLILSMDAEALLCDIRQKLVDQKTVITAQFSL